MRIYLIEAGYGSYKDYFNDIKKAFKTKSEAESYVLKHNALLDRLKEHQEFMMSKLNEDEYYDSVFNSPLNDVSEHGKCRIKEIELI